MESTIQIERYITHTHLELVGEEGNVTLQVLLFHL